jgi:hypothetical protein
VRSSLPASQQLILEAVEETADGRAAPGRLRTPGSGLRSFFVRAGSTRPAVHPVSNPGCLITAATCGECATYRGRASALRFICRRDAFGAGTTPAIGRSSPKDCQIWRVRRRGRPRVYARSWAWSVMLSADFPVKGDAADVAEYIGQYVTVQGVVDGDTITVLSISSRVLLPPARSIASAR